MDAGITFLDNAWEYHDGRSEELMGKAIADRRSQVFLMTKLCTHRMKLRVAMRELEESLRRLKTDYLTYGAFTKSSTNNDPDCPFCP